MVFPNFFITFVRHSFHTSHPCTSPSRETASPYTVLPPDTTLPSWHTRCLTRHAHATHPRLSQRTRPPPTLQPPQRAMPHAQLSLTAHTPPTLQPPQRAMPHTLLSLTAPHTPSTLQPPQRAMPRTRPTRKNAAMLSLAALSFLRRKSEPPQPKYYILQYYM